MSEYVLSIGWMAPLVDPIKSNELQEITERISDVGFTLNISYDGKLVYNDNEHSYDIHGLFFSDDPKKSKKQFIELCEKNGLNIVKNKIRHYVCVWYNGADSDMSMMTLEKFLKGETDV